MLINRHNWGSLADYRDVRCITHANGKKRKTNKTKTNRRYLATPRPPWWRTTMAGWQVGWGSVGHKSAAWVGLGCKDPHCPARSVQSLIHGLRAWGIVVISRLISRRSSCLRPLNPSALATAYVRAPTHYYCSTSLKHRRGVFDSKHRIQRENLRHTGRAPTPSGVKQLRLGAAIQQCKPRCKLPG